jgi:hypothetical protein
MLVNQRIWQMIKIECVDGILHADPVRRMIWTA